MNHHYINIFYVIINGVIIINAFLNHYKYKQSYYSCLNIKNTKMKETSEKKKDKIKKNDDIKNMMI